MGLTLRELQVARLVREGLTDRQVAEKLFITRRTAEWHLKQIFNKLGVNSRSQVAAWVAHDQAVGSTGQSPEERRPNLPVQVTTFVGRRKQLDKVQRLLDTKRLVTLTAVGGAGKTRLALEVARRSEDSYPDGTWFVDLTEVKDGHLIHRAFGSALGVHERPRQPMAESLIQHLGGLHLLLVVDNCEHVIEDCARLVDTIHRSCPGITILATSREPLRVSGETVWRLPLLATPDAAASIDLHELPECEAVGLFLDRAQLAAPNFKMSAKNAPAVAELSRRLEGIPLAIELAAARVGLMSPDQMLERLQDRFELLTGGSRTSPTRHRTLQSALDWSHDLLSDRERTLFRRLSVFAGSFTLEAIEAVCSGEDLEGGAITGLLGSLVDKSFVIVAGELSTPIRFRMLETLQHYGHQHLTDSAELERLSRCHCEFFVALAEEAFPNLIGREQEAWHQRLGQDLGNMRSALEWSAGREPLANLRLNSALTDFWYIHGLVQEGDGRLKKALAGYKVRDKLRARALAMGGQISYWRGDVGDYSAGCHECLEICRELGDREGTGRALAWVGQVAEWQGNFEEAREYYDSGLAISREVDNPRAIADILRYMGRLAMKEGDNARARAFLEESLAYYERIADQRPISWNLAYLGLNAIESGNFTVARSHLERAVSIGRALDSTILVAIPLMYFAALAAAQSHPSRALRLAEASESLAESTGAVPIRLTRSIVEGWLDKSRLELGPERLTACRSEGRAMTRESAVKYALNG